MIRKANDGDVIVVWDMTKSGLDGNNTGDRFSICQGQTIFGLTSTRGTSVVRHIGFFTSLDEFERIVAVRDMRADVSSSPSSDCYDLIGRPASSSHRGFLIAQGRKYKVK